MMSSKTNPDAVGYAGAVEAASLDRAAWSAAERGALKRIGGQGIAPVITMMQRCFFAKVVYSFVDKRPRGGRVAVARVPSNCPRPAHFTEPSPAQPVTSLSGWRLSK